MSSLGTPMIGVGFLIRNALIMAPGSVRTRLTAASAQSLSAASSAIAATHRENPRSDRIIAALIGDAPWPRGIRFQLRGEVDINQKLANPSGLRLPIYASSGTN